MTMNKVSGGDRIPVELFQILKDDAVKVLHSICQHIWKTPLSVSVAAGGSLRMAESGGAWKVVHEMCLM